jgi:hypothetical protein
MVSTRSTPAPRLPGAAASTSNTQDADSQTIRADSQIQPTPPADNEGNRRSAQGDGSSRGSTRAPENTFQEQINELKNMIEGLANAQRINNATPEVQEGPLNLNPRDDIPDADRHVTDLVNPANHQHRNPVKPPRLRDLKPYRGESLAEAKDFFYQAELLFRYDAGYYFPTPGRKIDYAAQAFEGEPLAVWRRHEHSGEAEHMSWKEFKEFMCNSIVDKDNRSRAAAQRIIHAKQRKGQTVNSFVTYLDSLEEDIEQETDHIRRERLLVGLLPDIARRISESPLQPTTRNELIKQACRLEGVDRIYRTDNESRDDKSDNQTHRTQKTHNANSKNDTSDNSRRRSRSPLASQGAAYRDRNVGKPSGAGDPSGKRWQGTVVCFRCQKQGHTSPSCTNEAVCRWCKGKHNSRDCMQKDRNQSGNALTQQ